MARIDQHRGSLRTAASVLVVVVLGGCTVRQQVAGGGLGLTVVGLGLSYSGTARAETTTANDVGIAMMLVGIVTLFTAAALEETAVHARDAERRAASRRPPRRDLAATPATPRPEAQAWALTQEAHAAARAGDCARVTALSAQVGALDPAFFAEVFMTDLAVQRCFIAAVEGAPVTAPVDVPGVPVPVPLPAPTDPPTDPLTGDGAATP